VYSLKKVATFYNCHNLGNWGIWESIFKDIIDAKDGNKALPEEVISPFNYVLYFVQHNTHFLSQKILYNILLCFVVQRCFRCNYSIFSLNLPCTILIVLWSMKYISSIVCCCWTCICNFSPFQTPPPPFFLLCFLGHVLVCLVSYHLLIGDPGSVPG
jgi:hypothetical protein